MGIITIALREEEYCIEVGRLLLMERIAIAEGDRG